jgi:hypothetical protein
MRNTRPIKEYRLMPRVTRFRCNACVKLPLKGLFQGSRWAVQVNLIGHVRLCAERPLAADAEVSESVLMTSYVRETDEEMRQVSNRTFHRILASLSPEGARQYGYAETPAVDLEGQFKKAAAAKDWGRVAQLSAELAGPGRPPAG